MTTTTVSGQSFIKTLRHYLDANESKLMTKNDTKGTSSVRGISNLPTALSNNNNNKSLGFPYMSLLAITSSSSSTTTLDKTPYMPTTGCFSLDIHYLYFLYVQFDHLGLDIGTSLLGNVPTEGYVTDHVDDDSGKAPSILSIGSVSSAMSTLSLGTGWQFWKNRQDTQEQHITNNSGHNLQQDIIHIHQCLSNIKALKLHMHVFVHPETGIPRSGQRAILGYEQPLTQQPHGTILLSLSPFKHLSFLELDQIHPSMISDWSSFTPRLISLVIKRAGIENVADLFNILQNSHLDNNDDEDGKSSINRTSDTTSNTNTIELHQLRMLSLQDNNLTTLDIEPLRQIQSITHLNLSSNLLIDIPQSLSILYNLHSLDLAYNMISFTMGINAVLGNIQELNLRGNRLTNVVGLDRLWALERLDLRDNRIEDMTEIHRLISLPNLDDVWVMGNPFTLTNSSYRVDLFTEFQQHGSSFKLDGMGPSFAEKLRFQASLNNTQRQHHDNTPAAMTTPSVTSSPTPPATTAIPTSNELDNTTASGTVDDHNIAIPPVSSSSANTSLDEGKSIKKAKPRKTKRVIQLPHGAVEPSMESNDMLKTDTEKSSHVLRYAELQQSIQPTLTRRRSSTSKRSSKSTSTALRIVGLDHHHHHLLLHLFWLTKILLGKLNHHPHQNVSLQKKPFVEKSKSCDKKLVLAG
ncbi:uncharacterized protein BX664DRAFT_56853 [Halteromyces radiatus]|uniref:uncharacterized protein n=1 Tax=Halteromyces radiatus TaxID=101107 RepID=UPI00221FF21B|nr:uncharacterized protein BX664DRAFT_56853 [Halteromyces radiatus]KAI8096336.1 hypothetical protein BX664DRAFT_56853 [Halteromyces radiatus]